MGNPGQGDECVKITVLAEHGGVYHLEPQHLKGRGGGFQSSRSAWTNHKFRPVKVIQTDLTRLLNLWSPTTCRVIKKKKVKDHEGWTWWHIPVIIALRKQKNYPKFKASLSYTVSSRVAWATENPV